MNYPEGQEVTSIQCSCGFAELADETLIDHLQLAFIPDDCQGNDGLFHEEMRSFACSCGLAPATSGTLDDHFLAVFTPDDHISPDGCTHEAAGT
jgi:hypothetical protein